jgi:triacylglycerol lipase
MTTPIQPGSAVAAARKQVLSTDYYALGYLNLATAAYTLEGEPASAIYPALRTTVPTITGYPDNGSFKVEWGPGISSNNGNLIYVASYYLPDDPAPVFSAVVIRGTDVQRKGFGLITQLEQDLEAHCQMPWPGGGPCAPVPPPPISGALVAKGTFDGLQTLLAITDMNAGTTLTDFLTSFLPTFPSLPLVVTGHSLGGALTQVMAPYLYTFAGSVAGASVTIVPNTFAGPSAGNAAFVAGYELMFPYCPCWYNTFDLVPMAFAGVDDMKSLWSVAPWSCGLKVPRLAELAIDDVTHRVKGRDYVQQTGAMARPLTGSCNCGMSMNDPLVTAPAEALSDPWFQMLLCQHLPPNGYYKLMVGYEGVFEIPFVQLPAPPRPAMVMPMPMPPN